MPSNLSQRVPLQLWFSRVGEVTEAIEQAVEKRFSPSEIQRLYATSNTNKRREFLLSRALMRHALEHQFGHSSQHWQFIERPNQAPTISNLPEHVYFSLTHSKGTICFALASSPIGIDLEIIKKNRDFTSLAKAVMSEQEIALFESQPDTLAENFYRSWCAKEAYYKMLSKQQQTGLTFKTLSITPQPINGTPPLLTTLQNDQFVLATAMQQKPDETMCKHFPCDDAVMAAFSRSFC